jgi:hypothetical protein
VVLQGGFALRLVQQARQAAVAKYVELVSLFQKEKVSLLGKTIIDDILHRELRQETFDFLKAQQHFWCRDFERRQCRVPGVGRLFVLGFFLVDWIQLHEAGAAFTVTVAVSAILLYLV